MKFKIGDKVRLAPGETWGMGERIGTVMKFQRDRFDNSITYVLVSYSGSTKHTCQIGFPFRLKEIELFVEPGKQLLFAFMEEK